MHRGTYSIFIIKQKNRNAKRSEHHSIEIDFESQIWIPKCETKLNSNKGFVFRMWKARLISQPFEKILQFVTLLLDPALFQWHWKENQYLRYNSWFSKESFKNIFLYVWLCVSAMVDKIKQNSCFQIKKNK